MLILQEHGDEILVKPEGILGAIGVSKQLIPGWEKLKALFPDETVHLKIDEEAIKGPTTVHVRKDRPEIIGAVAMKPMVEIEIEKGKEAGDIDPGIISSVVTQSDLVEMTPDTEVSVYVPKIILGDQLSGLAGGALLESWGSTTVNRATADMKFQLRVCRTLINRHPHIHHLRATRPTPDQFNYRFFARDKYLARYNNLERDAYQRVEGLPGLGFLDPVSWVLLVVIIIALVTYAYSAGQKSAMGNPVLYHHEEEWLESLRPKDATGSAYDNAKRTGEAENDLTVEPGLLPDPGLGEEPQRMGIMPIALGAAVIFGGLMVYDKIKKKK